MMDKRLIGLLGAAGVFAAGAATPAAAAHVPGTNLQARSYADLLAPIPNATMLLAESDAALASPAPEVILAQYHHHHHRTYHRRYRRRYHHHHSMIMVPDAPKPA